MLWIYSIPTGLTHLRWYPATVILLSLRPGYVNQKSLYLAWVKRKRPYHFETPAMTLFIQRLAC